MQVPSASSSPIHLLANRRPQTLDRPQARPGASATHRTRPASETFPSSVKIRDGMEASEKRSPLQNLLADWGKKGSEYDLNGNGKVDVPDLLMMLRQMGSGGSNDTPPPVEKPPPTVNPERPPVEPEKPMSPLEQLLADWGKKGSNSDLNGNGKVDVPDLLMMLRQMASGGSRHRQPISEAVAGPDNRTPHRSHAPHMPHGRAAAEHIARTLMNRIDTSDPSRLRETVERSSLADQQKRLILDRITAMAPRGRMVSVVA